MTHDVKLLIILNPDQLIDEHLLADRPDEDIHELVVGFVEAVLLLHAVAGHDGETWEELR